MIARLLGQNAIWIGVMAALLLVPAGTLHWPAAWVFLLGIGGLGVIFGLWLARTDPALLAERMRAPMQDGQPVADKIFVMVFGPVAFGWFIVMGLDHRFHGSGFPLALQTLGLVLVVLALVLIMWVMRSNSFAAPVVKLQAARRQHIVTTGPYAVVRHPMYSGTIFFFIGVPLLLGSWWGLTLAPLFVILFAIRTVIEERALRAGFPDYADYAARVRYRMAPGLW